MRGKSFAGELFFTKIEVAIWNKLHMFVVEVDAFTTFKKYLKWQGTD